MSGLEEKAVTAVTVKTKKGGTRKQKYAAGDVFAVPAGDDTYGFGRILFADVDQGEVALEFFRHRADAPLASPDVVDTGRLGNVAWVWAGNSIATSRWPVLHHTPGYRAPDHDEIRFQFWGGGDRYMMKDIEGRVIVRDVRSRPGPGGPAVRRRLPGRSDRLARGGRERPGPAADRGRSLDLPG